MNNQEPSRVRSSVSLDEDVRFVTNSGVSSVGVSGTLEFSEDSSKRLEHIKVSGGGGNLEDFVLW